MSYFNRIKSIEDEWYNEFYRIYSISFPVYEQRNKQQQISAFSDRRYNLYFLIGKDESDNEVMLSFIAFWDFEEYAYVEHFAVNDKYRGANIGTDTLMKFKETVKKNVVLEIDPVVDDVSSKRFEFYKKIGFGLCSYKHTHPAYYNHYEPHELLVLSTEILTQDLYNTFNKDLNETVMKE